MRDDILNFTGLTASCAMAAVPPYECRVSLWEQADASSRGTLPLRGQVALWVIATVQKLESLGRLRHGWDSYDGLPLNSEARSRTVETIRSLERTPEHANLPVPTVVLNSGGTVGLEWEQAGRELEIDIGADDELVYVTCDTDGKIKEGQVNKDAHFLNTLIRWFLSGHKGNSQSSSVTSHGSM